MDPTPHPDNPVLLLCSHIVENLPNSLVYVLDRTLGIVHAGGHLAPSSGHRVRMHSGTKTPAAMALRLQAAVAAHLSAALNGEETSFELGYPSGATFKVTTSPLHGIGGQPQQVLVVVTPVSAPGRDEETKVRELERLHRAVQAANVGLWDLDLRTGRVYYSPEWKRQLGYAEDEIGDSLVEWESRLHPDDRERAVQTSLSYTKAPWPDYELEFRMRRKDGTYRWIMTKASVVYDQDGKPGRLLGAHIDITERKRHEAAQLERDEIFRSMFENNQSIILLIDPADGAIVDTNRAAADYYGWTCSQLRSMNIGDINTAPLSELLSEMNRSPAEQSDRYFFQHRLADGSLRDVEVFRGPLRIGDRALIYSITRDVTDRMRAEDALRRSEAALRRSQAVAHVGHWTWDIHTNRVTFSDEMKRIYGIDPEMVGDDLDLLILRAVHPEDLARVQALNREVLGEQRRIEAEYRVVWPDGSVHYVHAMPGDSVLDEKGRFVHLSGVVQDITERKLIELEREQILNQLHDKAEQLSQVMRSVPEGVVLLDSERCVLLANPQAESLLALLATYTGENQLFQLGDLAITGVLAVPQGQVHQLQFGRQVYELIARSLETGPLPAGWVLVVRDVTAEQAMAKQMQRQEQLAAVGQLAAGIAHDFNNIMSVILMYSELLCVMPELPEPGRARAAIIIAQVERATRMIRQILDFSRQSVLERQVLDLLPLLKEQEKLLQQTLPEHVELAFSYTPGEYILAADPARMQQMIMNLAINARDAMPRGGQLRITLSHYRAVAEGTPLPAMTAGDWVRIEVRDTGTGIRPEDMNHIFEPFFTTKEPGKGTGLGLAQVHGIVAQHQGHIQVASEPGRGSVFTIFLPAQILAAATGPAAPQVTTVPQGSGETILVAEDDAALRSGVVSLLESFGYRVAQAADGYEALAYLFGDGPPDAHGKGPKVTVDVILSDVVMPRLGGMALVQTLRKLAVDTPVILMSGHPKDTKLGEWQGLNVSAWLDKPPSAAILASAVAKTLGKLKET